FGLFLLPAVGALLWPLRRRTLIVAALAPYLVGAILFYSCWGHGDARYLLGAVIVLLVATAIGSAAWCAAVAAPPRPGRTRAGGVPRAHARRAAGRAAGAPGASAAAAARARGRCRCHRRRWSGARALARRDRCSGGPVRPRAGLRGRRTGTRRERQRLSRSVP